MLRLTVLACLCYVVATFVFLYPLPFHLGDRIFENGDSYIHIWIFSWELHALLHSPGDFFNGNIFFPEANTLALSDLVLPDLLIFGPVLLLTGNPLVAYNATLLATFPLSALSMYALVWYFTRSFSAAFIAGFIFGFTPIRLSHLLHVQYESLMWIPLIFLFLHRWLKQQQWRDALLLGVLLVVQYLTTVYIALFLIPVLALAALTWFAIEKEFPSRRFLLQGICACALSVAMLVPFLLPYQNLQAWKVEPAESLKIFYSSDLWMNLFAIFPTNWMYGDLFRQFSVAPYERFYFSGFLVLVLAGLAFRRLADRTLWFLVSIAAGSYVIALGPYLQFSGHVTGVSLPYRWFFESLPGVTMLRVPARAGLITLAAVAAIAAIGWLRLWEWVSPRVRIPESLGVSIVILLLSVEFFSAPVPLLAEVSGENIPQVYAFLRDYSEPGGILEVPSTGRERDGTEFWERIYTYFSAYHFKPIVIGYSGYYPPGFGELVAASQNLPSDQALDLFEAIGVRSIVLHTRRLSDAQMMRWNMAISSGIRLHRVAEYPDGSQLVSLKPVLNISDNLNDLEWKLTIGSIRPDHVLPVRLQATGIKSPDFQYVVNPSMPRLPDQPSRRVQSTKLRAQWRDSSGEIVLDRMSEVRLPHVLNTAAIDLSLEAPTGPGTYRVDLSLMETPPLTVTTQVSLP